MATGKPWSAQDISMLMKFYDAGKPIKDIAVYLGRTALAVEKMLEKEHSKLYGTSTCIKQEKKAKTADIPLGMICKRASELHMSYGVYVGSRQYNDDVKKGYFKEACK